MKKIVTGNLDEQVILYPETRGWFLGNFMKNPDFLSDKVELKWGRHKKGEIKKGFFSKDSIKTFVILIEGKLIVKFPDLNEEKILSKLGDFLIFDVSQSTHESEFLDDTLLLVVRYNS